MRSFTTFVAFVGTCTLALPVSAQEISGFEARTYQGTKASLPYRLFKVKTPTPGTKYPVILFLHGAGERGDDNAKQLMANAGATVWATDAHQAEHPAYVIAPQCPLNQQWVDTDWTKGSYSTTTVPISDELTTALELADAIAKEFSTDPTRQYITGLSMGGYGTWDAVARNPDRFAAALPICGAGDPTRAEALSMLPLWAFHGDADPVVPVSGSRDMVAALKAEGSSVKYSEYPGVGHDAWTMTYANEEVVDWLFEQHQELPAMGGAGAGGGAGSSGGGAGGSGGGSAGMSAGAGGGGGMSTGGTGNTGESGAAGGGLSSGGATAMSGAAGELVRDNGTAESGDSGGCSIAGVPSHTGGVSGLVLGLLATASLARRRRAA
jgi:poly(3-hydroxybutyrate) depolymerase